jgi:hypothetical protein
VDDYEDDRVGKEEAAAAAAEEEKVEVHKENQSRLKSNSKLR